MNIRVINWILVLQNNSTTELKKAMAKNKN